MTKRLWVSIFILLHCFEAFGQADSSLNATPAAFVSVHSGALLARRGHGTSATASVIQGVRYKRIALGVGVGYDAYPEWRMVPVFAAFAHDFGRNRVKTLFIQMNTGYSKAWSTAGDESEFVFDSHGGFFYHPQIGYRIGEGKLRVQLAAGYKFQRISYEQSFRTWVWGYPSGAVKVVRDIERFSLQMGIGI